MKIDSIPFCELSPELLERWGEIQRSHGVLASPYFRPEFVAHVAAIRRRVEVGVIRDGDRTVGFFPFERGRGNVARPVGGCLSDYQAVIAAPETPWRVAELIRGCGLRAWEFDHQIASQQQLKPFTLKFSRSRQLHLADGFASYAEARRANGPRSFAEQLRKVRKLHREHQVQFEWHSASDAAFRQLLTWKSEQYRQAGLTDLFQSEWIVRLLEGLRQDPSPHLAGVLTVLTIDGQLGAVHFGIRSGRVLHFWFPAYNREFAKHSPGNCLLLMMAEHAAEHGVQCIDLGKGDEDYKQMLGNTAVELAEGVVETRPLSAVMRQGWQRARELVRQSPLREPARASVRWLRQVHHWISPQ